MTFRLGLTGGIGTGKSTVAKQLAERGVSLVDADGIAREIVVPGGPAYSPLVARFGEGVVTPDGTIDRVAVALIAFADPQALADLNAITHPLIGAEMGRRLDALDTLDTRDARIGEDVGGGSGGVEVGSTGGVAVAVIPLLRAHHVDALRLGAVVVVDCPVDVAVDRLVRLRGMVEADVRARIEAQVSRTERLELADYVVDNSGSPEALSAEVEHLWAWVQSRRAAEGRGGTG
ncbi:MAG: dephospho-CoA kinase [Acidimicrobiales bacterium]